MEEYGFSILMLIFTGAILLYALLLIATGDRRLLPYRIEKTMKKMQDEKGYIRALGRVVALVSLGPLIGGITGFFAPPLVTGIVIVAAFIFFLWLGIKTMPKGVDE